MHQHSSFEETHGWKLDLIARRARRHGLRGADVDDAVQELILDILNFDFDLSKANGASEAAVLTGMIDNRLASLLRSLSRYRGHLARLAASQSLQTEVDDSQDLTACDVKADVQTVLRSLPSLQQEICRQLMAGESITDIADSLGCGWHTVRRAVNDIRAAFIDAGIDQ